jgi:hypothetical protein
MKSPIKINTLEELVKLAMDTKGYYSYRFSLEDWNNYVGEGKERKMVQEYYLYYSSGSWRGVKIELSIELGEMLDKIWTHGPRWRNSDYITRKGQLTLPGMLKRLGNSDIDKKIKEAQNKEEKEIEKRNRNYARKNIREHAQKLSELLAKHSELLNDDKIVTPADLSSLIDLQDED